MLTDADERMKWNGMSARLAEAGSKTSQSAKTSAEPKRGRERKRVGEQLDILACALMNTHTQAQAKRLGSSRRCVGALLLRLSRTLSLALSHVGALFGYQSRVEIVD